MAARYDIGRKSVSWSWVFLISFTGLALPAAVLPLLQLPGIQGLPFFFAFSSSWALVSYALLFRGVQRLDLTESELRWHTLVRASGIPLSELRGIRAGRQGYFLIEAAGRKPLRVLVRPGLAEFTAAISQACHAQVQVGIVARTGVAAGREMGAPSGYGQRPASPSARPPWARVTGTTAAACAAGALLQALMAAGASQPARVGVFVGGLTAVNMLLRRGLGWAVITSAVIAGLVSAALLWTLLDSFHAARWSTVADAALCPLAGIAVARLLALAQPGPAQGKDQQGDS